ncbi:hypothetical protein COCON_G00117200, partial [Conger conger]
GSARSARSHTRLPGFPCTRDLSGDAHFNLGRLPDMAADLNPEWLSCLPSSWSYGVTRDGRVFFINEEAKSTTWLHPVTGEAVITGHRKTPDLPTGWEEGYTFEGARCFIKLNSALPPILKHRPRLSLAPSCSETR